MNNNQRNLTYALILSFVLVLLCFSSALAKTIRFTHSPRLTFEINNTYDDNIFLYSPDYIADFKNQIRSYRFPISTYDDFFTNLSFSLMFPLHIGLYKSSLNLYYKQYLYAVNGEKSYQIISANMNQSVTKQIGLEAGYLFLPRYLIRYYQDPTTSSTHFIGCTFAEHLFTIGLNYKLQNIQIKPYGRFEIDRYKENFSFYNSHAIRYGMDLNWSISRSAYLNLGIDRKQNSAKGPLPDISYDDNAVSAQIQTRVLNLEKLYLNLGADYAKRFYTTKNSATIDPFHRDRVDTKLSFSGGLEYRFSKNLRLNLEYNREIRRVSSPYESNIDDIKDYNNNKLTLGLRFNLSKLTEGG